LENKRNIIKHSSAIQTSGEASLLERKAWNVLLMNAFDSLKSEDIFKISIGDLNKALRFNSNDYDKLRETLKILNRTQVEWNILEKDKETEWEVTTLLAGVKIINGICYYSYNPLIKDRLSDPKIYAKLSLFEQSLIKGKYALILWELFKDYIGIGETGWIKIENFRKLLGLKADEYTEFKILNRDIIKKAIIQLNKMSVIYIDPETGVNKKREGRNIVALKFIIQHNENNVGKIKKLEDKWNTNQKQLSLPLPDPREGFQNQELLKSLTEEFGLLEEKAVEILKTKDEFQIYENLEYIRTWRDAGKIKASLSGFTISAIENNYRLDGKIKEKKKTDFKSIKKAEQKKILEEITTHVLQQRHIQYIEKEAELSEQERQKLKTEFEDLFRESSPGKSRANKAYEGKLYFFMKSKILPPEIDDLKAYAKSKGFDYDALNAEFKK